MIASRGIRSPPVKVYSESHHRQRRLHPVSRTNTHGRPACDDSPWMEWKISVTRSMHEKTHPHPSSLIPVHSGIRNTSLLESLPSQQARVTPPTRPPLRVGVVAGMRQRKVDPEVGSAADDLRFGHLNERGHQARLTLFDSAARPLHDDVLECGDEL